jgi:hypothetical protein
MTFKPLETYYTQFYDEDDSGKDITITWAFIGIDTNKVFSISIPSNLRTFSYQTSPWNQLRGLQAQFDEAIASGANVIAHPDIYKYIVKSIFKAKLLKKGIDD